MADVISTAKGMFGGFGLGNVWSILSYGMLFLVIVGVVGFFLYTYLMNKRFNKTITFWRRNSYTGFLVADKSIKAMTVRLDSFGNLGYRLKSPYETKNLLPRLLIEAKPNLHYVEYCEDGKIVEFAGITDFDDDRKAMKGIFSDTNTELARSSLHQMNNERYQTTSFWKENATLLVNIGAMCVIMVFLWLIVDKLIELVGSIGGLLDKAGTLQEAQSNIINSLNNLLSSQRLI